MSQNPHESLETLRSRIDAVDQQLLALLGKRQALVDQVIEVKIREGLPARIPERVSEVIAQVAAAAPAHGVSPMLAATLWTAMVEWFIAHEQQALKPSK